MKLSPGELLVDIAAAAVKRIRNRPKAVARRAAKAARKGAKQPADEQAEDFNSTDDQEVTAMNPLLLAVLGSLARTAVPAATAYLAGQGVSVAGVSPEGVVGIAAAVYVGAQAWSLARKIIRHFAEKPVKAGP